MKISTNKSVSIHLSINAYCDLNLAELVVRQILLQKMTNDCYLNSSCLEEENLNTDLTTQQLSNSAVQFLSQFLWEDARGAIAANLVEIAISQSSTSISAVNDLPRLFRRTNRDSPSKPLEYVESILLPVSSLKNDIYNSHQTDLWEKIGDKIGLQILQR